MSSNLSVTIMLVVVGLAALILSTVAIVIADDAQGIQGERGIPGIPGFDGAQGEQGIQGVQGVQGRAGPEGLPGEQGEQGLIGIQGVPGQPGMHIYIKRTQADLTMEKTSVLNCPTDWQVVRGDSIVVLGGRPDPPWIVQTDIRLVGGIQGISSTWLNLADEPGDIPWLIESHVFCLDPAYVTDETVTVIE